jgi:hypothetical protein
MRANSKKTTPCSKAATAKKILVNKIRDAQDGVRLAHDEALRKIIEAGAPHTMSLGEMIHKLRSRRAAAQAQEQAQEQANAVRQHCACTQPVSEPIKVELIITIRLEDARRSGKAKSKVSVK